MAKQLNQVGVNLTFSADTAQARAQLQELQKQLTNLVNTPASKLSLEQDISKAVSAAAELSAHLKAATNVNTGNLDFSKLNQSIKQSGMTLQQYGKQLQSLGPQGQQAFLSLTKSVANAEIPIRRSNALLKEMGTTLANAARWQLSSSILHGFMGAVQSAYGYAQDLNESLNNIRIVTNQNTDQMAKFAEQANKAAKALSTTTTEYTNASLIYYQQGLTDQQVKDRTDITIKMANVARESAETVSDQMTAVWNNFYDGSKSLEHYADVMTALGAATASSTSEISEGLNKFAAVAETVGLSYEYAAAALATVTSTTRQSADVVGTAFKTLFARIQDLELGKTLDDGTTLGSYSQALAKVGIDIKTTSGEMKQMDVILEEMANKWTTLGEDQQVALAQSVAGVRQYTQLIALMDNWDFMEKNLATAESSSGALQAQADIYAESWEAASDRVTAAAEAIYSSLINDEFFIDLLNNIEKILKFVDSLIDSLGGLKGVLTTVGVVMTKVMHDSLAQGLTNMAYNIKMSTKSGREQAKAEQKKFIDDAVGDIPETTDYTTPTEQAQQSSLRSQLELQQQYMNNVDKMTLQEQERNKMLMESTRLLKEQAVEAAKLKEAAEKEVSDTTDDIRSDVISGLQKNGIADSKEEAEEYYDTNVANKIVEMQKVSDEQATIGAKVATVISARKTSLINPDDAKNAQVLSDSLSDLKNALLGVDEGVRQAAGIDDEFFKKLDDGTIDVEELKTALAKLNQEYDIQIKNSAADVKDNVSPDMAPKVDNLVASIRKKTQATIESANADRDAAAMQDTAGKKIEESTGKQKSWADSLVSTASAVMSFSSALSMLGSMWDTLQDPDASGWEKLGSVFSTLAMVIPMLITGWKSLQEAKIKDTIVNALNTASEKILEHQKRKTAAANVENATTQDGETKKQLKDIIVNKAQELSEKGKQTWGNIKTGAKELPGKIKGGFSKAASGIKNFKGLAGLGKAGGAAASGAGGAGGAAAGGGLTAAGGTLAASLGLVAAGIAVVVGGIAWAVHQSKAAERAVEKAKQSAEELQKNYDTVKASYDDFMSKASNYESAVDSVAELTKGTQEYEDAVKAANDAAMELLATNDNLAYTIENGQIVIDEESLEAQKDAERTKLENANAAKIAGQNQVRLAEENLAKRDMARENLKSDSGSWTALGNTAAMGGVGAGAGALIGTAIMPGIGTAVGAIIGGVAGLIGGAIGAATTGTSSTEENEALEALEAAYLKDDTILQKLKDGTIDWDALGIEDEALRKSLQANADEVGELVKEMAANTSAIQAQNDAIAANTLADNVAVQNSKYQDEIIDITGDAYGELYDKAMESDWVDTWGKEGIAQIDGANDEAKKVFNEYLKYAGLEGQGYELTDTTGTDSNRKFVYKDAEGNEQTVSLETMQAARAAYEANSQLDDVANKLVATFSKLEASGKKEDQALLSFLSTKNFENATRSEIEAMQAQVGDDGVASDEELKKILGVEDLEAAALQYGYASAEELKKAFNDSLADADVALDEVDIEGMSSELSANLTIGASKKLQNIIKDMNAGPLGEQAGQEFLTGLNTMLSGMDAEDQTEAMERIAAIDWSAYDAADQVKDIVEELGGSINMTDEEFQQWVHTMNMANMAIPNAEQVIADMEKIKKLSEETNIGDIISQEDYELLVKYNSALADYFTILADGSAMMTGDALDFQQEMKKTQQNYLSNVIEEAAANAGALQQKQAAGMRALGISDEGGADQYRVGQYSDDKEWYYGTNVGKQIEFLESQGYDLSQIQGAIDDYNEGNTMTIEHLNAIANAVNGQVDEWKALDTAAESALADMQAYMIQYAMTAESAAERQQMLKDGLITEEAYAKAAEAAMNTEAWDGLDTEEVQDYASYLEDAFGLAEEQAEEVARATMKMDKGIEALTENWADWNDVLKNSSKSSQEYAKAINGLKNALSDALDVSEEFISTAFIENEDNLKLIEDAANGSTEALDQLGIALAEDIAKQAIKANGVANMDGAISQVETAMDRINELLSQELPDLQVGQIVNQDELINQMNAVVEAAKMTTEQANAYYRSMGFVPEFETVPMTASTVVPLTTTVHERSNLQFDDDGNLIGWTDKEYSTTTQAPAGENIVNAMSMSVQTADGKGEAPQVPTNKVKSLTYTGGGSMSNYSSVNAGGNKSSGGGNKKEKKNLSDELDRYHEVKETLSDITRKMDALSKARDRAFGQSKVDLFNQALAETENKLAAQEQYLKEIQDYYAQDRATIIDKYGASLDEEGRIANYEELYANSLATYNKAVDDVNRGAITEDQFAAYEKAYEQFKEDISQYEETLNLLEDEQQTFIDLQNEMADLALEKIQYIVEYKIKIEDAELQYLDYQFSHLGDTVDDLAVKLTLFEGQVEANLTKIKAYQEGIKEVFKDVLTEDQMNSLLQGDFSVLDGLNLTSNQVEALESWRDALYDANNTLYELRETMQTEILETFQNMNDEMDKSAATIDHLSSVMNSYKNIIDLIGRKTTNVTDEIMQGLNRSIIQASTDALRVAKATYDMNKQALVDAQEERAKAEAEGRTKDVKMWDETIETIEEKVRDSESSMLDAWSSALEEAANAFEESVEMAIAAAEKSMSGMYDSFDQMKTAFDQQTEINDRYLDDYQKIYELNKLIRDVNKSIDETDNIKAKKELRDLEEEIAAIYESEEEVSQYQVDHMRKQYELRLAQIALEEAQNAKSQVRMRKDSEGNWSYIYTADSDAVGNAEQTYEDKLYELQNLIQEYIQQMQESAINAQSEMMSAISDLRVQDFASEQEYQAEVTRIIEYYTGMRKYYMSELDKALADSKEVYEQDWVEYSKYTGYKISQDDKWVQDYKETTYAIMTGTTSLEQDNAAFERTTTELLNRLSGAYSQWQIDINGYNETVGQSMDTLGEEVENMASTIETETDRAATDAENNAERMGTAFDSILSDVSTWQSNYSTYIQNAIDKNLALVNSINAAIAAAAAANNTDFTPKVDYSNLGTDDGMGEDDVDKDTDGDGGQGGTTVKPTTKEPQVGSGTLTPYYYSVTQKKVTGRSYAYAAIPVSSINSSGWGIYGAYLVEKTGNRNQERAVLISDYLTATGLSQSSLLSQFGPLATSGIPRFDTGGYTGDWGPDGRIAMLHQKELVLNAQDTENMLRTVEVVRNIAKVIDLNAGSQSAGLGYISTANAHVNDSTIQQEVTIHAEFPNATDHYEIEEAFNTLINQASQFANRKNK